MSKRWDYRTDPLYLRLMAEAADLEWQCIEHEFLADLVRANGEPVEAIEVARVSVQGVLGNGAAGSCH